MLSSDSKPLALWDSASLGVTAFPWETKVSIPAIEHGTIGRESPAPALPPGGMEGSLRRDSRPPLEGLMWLNASESNDCRGTPLKEPRVS